VPNPANPQGYNRFSYVLNSPMMYIDPTGHEYTCVGVDDDFDCDAWVAAALEQLRTSGDTGEKLYWQFRDYLDNNDVTFVFSDENEHKMSTTYPTEDSAGKITIRLPYWDGWEEGDEIDAMTIALLGHEIWHLLHPEFAGSVEGELQAYDVQYLILVDLGVPIREIKILRKIHNLVAKGVMFLTDEELEYGRDLIMEQCHSCDGYADLDLRSGYYPDSFRRKPGGRVLGTPYSPPYTR
jgi:hypothetical protein